MKSVNVSTGTTTMNGGSSSKHVITERKSDESRAKQDPDPTEHPTVIILLLKPMLKTINSSTTVELDTDLLSPEMIDAFLNDLQVVYLQTISWLLGYPGIIAKNDPTKDEDLENLAKLEKEKEKLEGNLKEIVAKLSFFRDVKSSM